MRLAALSDNIPQSYPIFQVEIEKLLVSSAKKCGFSGAGVLFSPTKENPKRFSRWWRGLKRCCGGAWFSYERLHAPVRGAERFFIKANVLFCVPKENQKSTSDFDALDPRERGYSPLSDPKGVVETEKS